MVSPRDWQGALPDCGYVLADGDGSDHDCADSGGGGDQAGVGYAAVLWNCAGSGYKRGRSRFRMGRVGLLVFRKPWPSMARTIYGDQERYKQAYLSEIPGSYFTGDGARRDADGYFWLMGRVDDVINVSGHRLGTMEIESALVAHPKVAEAAVVGRPDEMKGQAIAAFVTLEDGHGPSEELRQELRQWVAKEIGALARPDDLTFTDALPKTRSGKIMRRLLRELATTGEVKGDTTTLEDFGVMAKLREGDE